MAKLTMQAVANNDRTHTVTKSTDDAIGSAVAAIIFDDTKTKIDIMDGLRALMRAVSREFGKTSLPSEVPTSGTSLE